MTQEERKNRSVEREEENERERERERERGGKCDKFSQFLTLLQRGEN